MLKWREIAIPMFPLSAEYPENRRSLLPSIEGILSEDTLSTIRDLLPSEYDPVFCHGDFLAGNVLYKAGSNQGLIDFEYAGYSYGAFDIANMINESHIDNSEPEWPYWGFVEKYKADNARIAKWVKAYGEGIDFWVEVKVFICVNNFYWALWGLTMVPSWERGDFLDHMSYAVMRYETGMKDLVEIQELGRQGLREIGEKFFN